eukprot:Skav229856  [mRNA]  locus=scaffold148:72899:73284:- [translate_table: standard]
MGVMVHYLKQRAHLGFRADQKGMCMKDIFAYIVSQLGSLECMDEQIRSLMGDMLVNNLANVGRATEDLLKKLGQKKTLSYQSSTVETLSCLESSKPPDP